MIPFIQTVAQAKFEVYAIYTKSVVVQIDALQLKRRLVKRFGIAETVRECSGWKKANTRRIVSGCVLHRKRAKNGVCMAIN